jgi:DNA polymerase III subunit beta
MEFTCVTEQFKNALLRIEKNAGKKLTLPILNAILIQAENGLITLTTTNLETGIRTQVNGNVVHPGTAAIPARTLSTYIAALHDPQVHIKSENEHIFLTTDKSSTLIKGYISDEFPTLPKVQKDTVYTLSAQDLKKALSFVIIASASTDIKPEISSVYVQFSKNCITLAATDSFRLAEYTLPGTIPTPRAHTSFLLPIRSAGELLHLLEDSDGTVEVNITNGQATFITDTFHLVTRLTEGSFPDYKQIIPTSFPTTITVKKGDVLSALRVTSLFTGKLNDVLLQVDPRTNSFTLKTAHADVGEHTSTLQAEVIGEPLQIHFNYRYILDGVQHNDAEEIFLGFSSSTGPLLIRSKEAGFSFYVVMPMKV